MVAHKSMALFFNPYMNRTAMAEVNILLVHLEFHIPSDV
jgi:hypothetical protein